MLDANSSWLAHSAQNIGLIFLSLFLLPLDTSLLCLTYCLRFFFTSQATAHRRNVRGTHTPYFAPRTVLVTGVGMTKGLALARLFYAAGHNVIGADFEPTFAPTACGHFSKSLKNFYKLAKPVGGREGTARYMQCLLHIIRQEKVDIWVSCSGVASAVEDGEAKEMIELVTPCKAVQFNVADTKRLHEKHSFIEYTNSLGLTIPKTHTITLHESALRILESVQGGKEKYIMKYIGTDDAVRGDMTMLPRPTALETSQHISRLSISEERPWILQQYIKGPEYCTHALVIRGEVKAFVACPSAELLMHYEALPPDSALSRAMLEFTQTHAAASGDDFTGHLSFDFLVDENEIGNAEKNRVTLYPIECNPRAHTAVALFSNTPEMAAAYMTLLEPPHQGFNGRDHGANGVPAVPPIYPRRPSKYYWIGHDLVTCAILPLLAVFSASGPRIEEVLESFLKFLEHVVFWKDGTYEFWDPLPWWWLYHVYWPSQLLLALLTGKRWSRINVSTTKMFEC
ncbi:hypothetical protein LTR66_002105 [Elasticomyces elasticus]|nr:hypothetical protein LTR28_013701 [Elasticomyces elasticus]KAK4998713.1 hypothetical protein LTR66_002105 [Elasticomyces elasticus]